MQIDRQTDRVKHRQTDRQTAIETEIDKKADRQTKRKRQREKQRQTDRQTDRKRQTDRQTYYSNTESLQLHRIGFQESCANNYTDRDIARYTTSVGRAVKTFLITVSSESTLTNTNTVLF